MVAIIGMMLVSGLKPDTFDPLDQWVLSFAGLILFVAAAAFLVQEYLHRFGGQ